MSEGIDESIVEDAALTRLGELAVLRTTTRTFATLRDTLPPKLLSGELSVAAAAKLGRGRA